MANILIIDDDELICDLLSQLTLRQGHEPAHALTLKDGLDRAKTGSFDIILLDICLPDGSGLDSLKTLKEMPSAPEVIIITGEGDPDGAEVAINTGAWDYLEKPFSNKKMELILFRTLKYRDEKAKRQSSSLMRQLGIIGSSSRLRESFDQLRTAASSDINVLLAGETGTGKELFAHAVHSMGKRSDKPFVVVDCAALPDSLVDSTLFGHIKGAFTGADRSKDGLVKLADGGILFMDEVGELPLALQKKFLRVLQERRFLPVGGHKEVESNFRLLSATNRNLWDMVEKRQFRQDLLYRLQSFIIQLPPLRERESDLKELAEYYLKRASRKYDIGPKAFSPDFLDRLTKYDWPGNVRELFYSLESAILSSGEESTLYGFHLPTPIRAKIARASISKKPKPETVPKGLPRLKEFRAAMEKQYLADLMVLTGNNIKKACEASGISQSRYYGLLKKYNLSSSQEKHS